MNERMLLQGLLLLHPPLIIILNDGDDNDKRCFQWRSEGGRGGNFARKCITTTLMCVCGGGGCIFGPRRQYSPAPPLAVLLHRQLRRIVFGSIAVCVCVCVCVCGREALAYHGH